jgi:hypothetical protein
MTLNLTWRSRISDSAWARASACVLPADMPLLTYRLLMILTGTKTRRRRAGARKGWRRCRVEVAGVHVDQRFGRDAAFRVVESLQFRRQQSAGQSVPFSGSANQRSRG